MGLAGGTNLYGFAGGDPVNFSDPFGLWDPAAHLKLLTHALAGVATAAQISSLNGASKKEDLLHNFDNSRHYLADNGQDAMEAAKRSEALIASNIGKARAAHLAGDDPTALSLLGAAMHTMMDGTSPAHVKNGLPTTYPGPGHSMCDHCGGIERSQDITPGILAANDQRLRGAWGQVFGPPKK